MNNQQQWQRYDLLKLLMAILLILIVIGLLLGAGQKSPDPTASVVAITSETTVIPEETITPTHTETPEITNTPTPTVTTDTPTPTVTVTTTATPTSTITPTASMTPSEVPDVPIVEDACSLAIESRLEVGATALVQTNLNFRAAPGLDQEIQLVHLPGVRLEIIGGPICIRHLDGAYRWWQVQRPNGTAGWSAEGSLTRFFYFLEPVD